MLRLCVRKRGEHAQLSGGSMISQRTPDARAKFGYFFQNKNAFQ